MWCKLKHRNNGITTTFGSKRQQQRRRRRRRWTERNVSANCVGRRNEFGIETSNCFHLNSLRFFSVCFFLSFDSRCCLRALTGTLFVLALRFSSDPNIEHMPCVSESARERLFRFFLFLNCWPAAVAAVASAAVQLLIWCCCYYCQLTSGDNALLLSARVAWQICTHHNIFAVPSSATLYFIGRSRHMDTLVCARWTPKINMDNCRTVAI